MQGSVGFVLPFHNKVLKNTTYVNPCPAFAFSSSAAPWHTGYMFMLSDWLQRQTIHSRSLLIVVLIAVAIIAQPPTPAPEPASPPPKHPSIHRKAPAIPSSLPRGGRVLFPQYTLVALYGAPNTPALGVLGEQPIEASLARARDVAASYQPLTASTVLPSLEIIATTASASPTDNGDYSRETSINELMPWITAAQLAGEYVILDIQPGRSDFLSQVRQYEPLLKYPHVGLALDPEWRLKPDQLHLKQIGSVDASEINQTADWLAELTARHKLPQKLFLLHQFRLDMITNRAALNLSHPELATVIQMDGSGTQEQKRATWQAITAGADPAIRFGWKNFYKQDATLLPPADTMLNTPTPVYISYQ